MDSACCARRSALVIEVCDSASASVSGTAVAAWSALTSQSSSSQASGTLILLPAMNRDLTKDWMTGKVEICLVVSKVYEGLMTCNYRKHVL